jgi:hypothetical protein
MLLNKNMLEYSIFAETAQGRAKRKTPLLRILKPVGYGVRHGI